MIFGLCRSSVTSGNVPAFVNSGLFMEDPDGSLCNSSRNLSIASEGRALLLTADS